MVSLRAPDPPNPMNTVPGGDAYCAWIGHDKGKPIASVTKLPASPVPPSTDRTQIVLKQEPMTTTGVDRHRCPVLRGVSKIR